MCVCRQTEHAKERTQFGSKIESYGAIQEKIARMMMKQYVTEVACLCELMYPVRVIHVTVETVDEKNVYVHVSS